MTTAKNRVKSGNANPAPMLANARIDRQSRKVVTFHTSHNGRLNTSANLSRGQGRP